MFWEGQKRWAEHLVLEAAENAPALEALPGSCGEETGGQAGGGRGSRPRRALQKTHPEAQRFASAAAGRQNPRSPGPRRSAPPCDSGPRLPEFGPAGATYPTVSSLLASPLFSPLENGADAPAAVADLNRGEPGAGPAAVPGERGSTRLDRGPRLALGGRMHLPETTRVR